MYTTGAAFRLVYQTELIQMELCHLRTNAIAVFSPCPPPTEQPHRCPLSRFRFTIQFLLTCAQYRCDVTYCNEGTNGLPLQTLFGFERVHVKAGETVQVYLYPALTELSVTNLDGSRSPLEGDFVVRFGVVEAAKSGNWNGVCKINVVCILFLIKKLSHHNILD